MVSMATDSSRRYIMGGNVVNTLALYFLSDLLHLAGNENIYNISDEFEIRLDRTKDCGVSCSCASEKIP